MPNDIDTPVFTTGAAARLCGVPMARWRAWWARTPVARLGKKVSRSWRFSRRDMYVISLWATLLNHGHGPPHAALQTARLVAGHRGPTVYVTRDGDEIAVTSEPPAGPALAIPTSEIWRRVAQAEEEQCIL